MMKSLVISSLFSLLCGAAMAESVTIRIDIDPKSGLHYSQVHDLDAASASDCVGSGGHLVMDLHAKECHAIPPKRPGGKPGVNCPNICVGKEGDTADGGEMPRHRPARRSDTIPAVDKTDGA